MRIGWLGNFGPLQRLSGWLFLQLSRRMWDWRAPGEPPPPTGPGSGRRPLLLPAGLARAWGLPVAPPGSAG